MSFLNSPNLFLGLFSYILSPYCHSSVTFCVCLWLFQPSVSLVFLCISASLSFCPKSLSLSLPIPLACQAPDPGSTG